MGLVCLCQNKGGGGHPFCVAKSPHEGELQIAAVPVDAEARFSFLVVLIQSQEGEDRCSRVGPVDLIDSG